MLINQLLLTFIFDDHSEIVKATHLAANLEAIHQIDNNTKIFLADMVQKAIL